jgi:hypothetical protein
VGGYIKYWILVHGVEVASGDALFTDSFESVGTLLDSDARFLTRSQPDEIPEPATLALLSVTACGLGAYVRRRRKA